MNNIPKDLKPLASGMLSVGSMLFVACSRDIPTYLEPAVVPIDEDEVVLWQDTTAGEKVIRRLLCVVMRVRRVERASSDRQPVDRLVLPAADLQ